MFYVFYLFIFVYYNNIRMYFRAKRNVTMTDHINGGSWYLIKEDNIYKGDHTPTIYHPQTLKPEIGIVVKCEDGRSRKFDIGDFYTLEEWREIQLNNILD